MITKEQYLNALLIVEEYHSQINIAIKKNKPSLRDFNLTRGDIIKYLGGSQSKYLTKGNNYRLTGSPFGHWVCIINDKGSRMQSRQSFFANTHTITNESTT
jgi:hypothetical protein